MVKVRVMQRRARLSRIFFMDRFPAKSTGRGNGETGPFVPSDLRFRLDYRNPTAIHGGWIGIL